MKYLQQYQTLLCGRRFHDRRPFQHVQLEYGWYCKIERGGELAVPLKPTGAPKF